MVAAYVFEAYSVVLPKLCETLAESEASSPSDPSSGTLAENSVPIARVGDASADSPQFSV